jgi:hypothetical protein
VVKVSTSTDANTWTTFTFGPKNLEAGLANHSFDLPDLETTNSFLYLKLNLYAQGNPNSVGTAMIRLSLQDLKDNIPSPELEYRIMRVGFNYIPVVGTTNNMYWGALLSNNAIRIYSAPDSLPISDAEFTDRQIIPFTYAGRGQLQCQSPDGFNWCARADSRMSGGFLSGNTLGFYWNSMQDDTFPQPYLYIALFRTSDLGFLDRALLWHPDVSWMYGDISPNSLGQLGITSFYGNSVLAPSLAAGNNIGMSNDGSLNWQLINIVIGTNAPSTASWGDFLTLRPDPENPSRWIGAGYSLQDGTRKEHIKPVYFSIAP